MAIPGLIEAVERLARDTDNVAAAQRMVALMTVAGVHAFRGLDPAHFGMAGEVQTDLAGYAALPVYAFNAPRLRVYGSFMNVTPRTFVCCAVDGGQTGRTAKAAALARAAAEFG